MSFVFIYETDTDHHLEEDEQFARALQESLNDESPPRQKESLNDEPPPCQNVPVDNPATSLPPYTFPSSGFRYLLQWYIIMHN